MPRKSDAQRAAAQCFVIMSFDPQLDEVYEEIYKPACEELGVACRRIDESHVPGSITTDIINKILDADFIIADLTLLNANVFYELGFAHTAHKSVILTTQQSRNNLPFDIRPLKVIRYEQTISGRKKLLQTLGPVIRDVLNMPRETFDNPISTALKERNLRLQDTTVARLDKERLMQIIRLHKRSTKYLAFVILDNALLNMDAGRLIRNSPDFTDRVYRKIEKSAKECAGFSGNCIDDVHKLLTDLFTPEKLSEVIDSTQNILLNPELARDDKRTEGQQHIEKRTDEIFKEIEDEIDTLYSLQKCE